MAVLLVIIFPELSNAQNTREIEVSLSSDDFTLVRDDSITDINMNPELNCFFLGISAPRIPYFTKNILIPKNCTKASATFVSNNETVYDDIELRMLVPFIPGYDHIVNNVERGTFATFPDSQIENVKLFDYDGYKVATILFTPFRYDAVSKRLTVYNDLVLTLTTEAERSMSLTPYSEKDREYVKSMVINNEEMDSLYPLNNTRQATNTVGGLEDITDRLYYLIITSSTLENSFDSLVLLKDYKGKIARVVTTDSIYSHYSTGTNAQKIRNFIKLQKINHSELEYVLLGGDYSIIPAVKIELKNPIDSMITLGVPSDMFYASFNYNFTSIAPTNNVFGVPSSNRTDNLNPNVIVSRLPFNNADDISRYIAKLWKHETYSLENLPTRDFLFAGAEIDSVITGMSDAHWKGNTLKNTYLNRDSLLRCNTLFDTGSDFINNSYTLDSTLLNQVMSQGTHIMHMDCHGGSFFWKLKKIEPSPYYKVENTIGLHQKSPFVLFNASCHVNDFSSSYFLGKGFLINGANTINFLGCSSYSIGEEGIDISHDPSILCSKITIDKTFSFAELDSKYSLGHGYSIMKDSIITKITNKVNDSYFWMLFSYNMLGDPDVKLYHKQPCKTGKPRTYATKEHFTIENDTLNFFSIIENVDSFYNVYKPLSNSHGIIEFNNEFDGLRIGYFNNNKILQIIDPLFDTDLYLYGTQIYNPKTYKYRNFHIGKMPDNSLQGTVTIQSGANQEFIYSGEINIYRSFTCKQGAELIIRPTNY